MLDKRSSTPLTYLVIVQLGETFWKLNLQSPENSKDALNPRSPPPFQLTTFGIMLRYNGCNTKVEMHDLFYYI